MEDNGEGVRLGIGTALARELRDGDSVAVNGVCLTATSVDGDAFGADVMHETLRRSSLGAVREGGPVNLELPLRAADRLGGHVVQGHVDGIGTVTRRARGRLLARGHASRPSPSCCATSSRRARSRSTASA